MGRPGHTTAVPSYIRLGNKNHHRNSDLVGFITFKGIYGEPRRRGVTTSLGNCCAVGSLPRLPCTATVAEH